MPAPLRRKRFLGAGYVPDLRLTATHTPSACGLRSHSEFAFSIPVAMERHASTRVMAGLG